MLVLRLGTWLMGSGQHMAFQMELYLGLLVFVGYVLFDTQVSGCLNLIAVAGHAHVPICPSRSIPCRLMFGLCLMQLTPYVEEPQWCPQFPYKLL